ncbi:MAG: hypothetical protein CMI74_10305, partial [Candidatus Pelagibacter sp.]|nr:hypothetical protein [Candidatus Pelagibacter sp.]
MAKSRGRKFAEITSPASGVFDLTSVPTITNAKLQNSAMTLAGSSVSLGGTGVADTDALSEGSSNLYFTDARVQTFLGGGTLAGNVVVPDNRSIYLGSSSDFRMVHNTTNTQLINATGALQITSNGGFDVTGAATFSSTATFSGTVLPASDSAYNIGTNATRFANAYFDTMYGTVGTAAQPNITSVGTLTHVHVLNGGGSVGGTTPRIYSSASATLDISTNSARRLTIDGSGNVSVLTSGVALNAPVLQVTNGNVATYTGTTPAIHSPSSGTMAFSMAGSERMRIDSSGKLFVGDGSPQWPTGTIGNSAGRHMFHYNGDTVLLLWDESTAAQGNSGSLFLGGKPVGSSNYFSGGAIYGNVENGSNAAGELLLKTTNTSGGLATALTINSSQNATFAGDVQAAGLYVGSTNTNYDFYNNGTGYNNGAFTVDDTLTVNGQVASTTVDTGTLYVGNNNTELSENNLYAKSGGHFYIDHNTVGQDFIFRVSNSSSRDMYGPRFFSSGQVSVGPDNSTTSAHQMKINSTTMGLRIKSGNGGYSALTFSGDNENTIGSITTT